jgi:asparagine synthase (glutamine-hydrolysing)
LAIIDLSSAANQPMVSGDGRYALVFNGAIYNYIELREELRSAGHAFRTNSDTEVLLRAIAHWGTEAFGRLLGMFTVGFHDREAQRLILARDRFGVKPLYYRSGDDGFWFASTPGAMADAAGAPVDLEYAARGIRLKYYEDECDISPYRGIHALPAGHFAVLEAGGHAPRVSAYYDLAAQAAATIDELAGRRGEDLGSELRARLRHATSIRLRADVPLGISLSSGVDSTSIFALCTEAGTTPRGYCFGDPDDERSEAPAVRKFAADLGQEVRFVQQADGTRAKTLFWKTLRAQGAPFPHSSQIAQYAVFEAARADGIKVMLGGQGGDEAFMGYRKFFLFHLREILRRRAWAEMPGVGRNMLQVLPAIMARAGLFWGERHRYAGQGLSTGLALPQLSHSPSPGEGLGSDSRDRQILDVTRYSLPSLLRYEDRNSMGNSIESRLPFLDHRVIEFGVALPTKVKLRNGMGKALLRQSMRGLVPDRILFNRDKRGFDTRHQAWIFGGLGAAVREGVAVHRHQAAAFIPDGADLERYFSDGELASQPSRFAEATTLLWLLDSTLASYPT